MTCTGRRSGDLSGKEKAAYAFLVLSAIVACVFVIGIGCSVPLAGEASDEDVLVGVGCSTFLTFSGTIIAIATMAAQKRKHTGVIYGNSFYFAVTALILEVFPFGLLMWLSEVGSLVPEAPKPSSSGGAHDTSVVVRVPSPSTATPPTPARAQSPRPSAAAGRGSPASIVIPGGSSTRVVAGTTADGTAVFAAQRDSIDVGVSANVINLILAVDRSGSMAGSRWNSVQRGVAEAIGQLSDVDVVTIIPFNNTVQAIGPAPKCRFPLHAFAALSPDGNTKLYDATAMALITALELHRAVDQATHLTRTTYVVVMTDGEDNDSTATLAQLKELLLAINRLRDFEVCYVAVAR
jgi:Mg-chelatase subunit ChlD